MDKISYMIVQDRLSSVGSFVLCDAAARGFPIRYTSAGFSDLFGYLPAECLDRKCKDIVGEPTIRKSDPTLDELAKKVGLSKEMACSALSRLTQFASLQCSAVTANPKDCVGYAIALNRTKAGSLIVVEIVILMFTHPMFGWTYCVGLQRDATSDVSVRELMQAVAIGQYTRLLKRLEPEAQSRLRSLGLETTLVGQYLNLKVEELWHRMIQDMFGLENAQCPTTEVLTHSSTGLARSSACSTKANSAFPSTAFTGSTSSPEEELASSISDNSGGSGAPRSGDSGGSGASRSRGSGSGSGVSGSRNSGSLSGCGVSGSQDSGVSDSRNSGSGSRSQHSAGSRSRSDSTAPNRSSVLEYRLRPFQLALGAFLCFSSGATLVLFAHRRRR